MTSERLAQALLDLEEVRGQLADGELDEPTARRLIATYEEEIAALQADSAEDGEAPVRRSGRRAIAGTLLVVAAVASIGWTVNRSASERSGGFITGSDSVAGATEGGVDLSTISNETMAEVIAANTDNPQINRMRLALAGRYFDEGDQQEAFRWYQEVLDNDPSPVEASEALGRLGVLVYASGDTELAIRTLERSLELAPGNVDAQFFLGRIYADLGRVEDARTVWGGIAANDELPDEIRDLAREAIDLLEAGS